MNARVILAATSGRISGVDVFSGNLVRGLRRIGVPAHIVLTAPHWPPPDPMPLPVDVPVQTLPVGRYAGWPARWRAMRRYLEKRAPCIYIPNYDWNHSCVSPTLSPQVGIVGIVHSDDPQHYEHVARLGRYWNAIVAVSHIIAERTVALAPDLAPRLITLPYGVAVPTRPPERRARKGAPLQLIYAGRLVQEQKRVLDLPRIVRALVERGVPVELTVIGGGTEQRPLAQACVELGIQENVKFLGILPNDRVLAALARHDVFLLPSAFEGLPVSLLEAMGQGCVPVVTDTRSGIPELVQNGVNGYRVPVGEIAAFAERLAALYQNPALRKRLAAQAHHTVLNGGYTIEDMAQRYVALFERVWREANTGAYRRPAGKILPPPALEQAASWPGRLRNLARSLQARLTVGRKG